MSEQQDNTEIERDLEPDEMLSVPTTFEDEEAFVAYVRSVLDVDKDYDTASNALWKVALAGMNYAEDHMGVSSAQRAWAEMAFLAYSRNIQGPMLLLDGTHMLYPQYNVRGQVEEWLHSSQEWVKETAQHLISTTKKVETAPYVWEHWTRLVEEDGCHHCAQVAAQIEDDDAEVIEIHLDAPDEETPTPE